MAQRVTQESQGRGESREDQDLLDHPANEGKRVKEVTKERKGLLVSQAYLGNLERKVSGACQATEVFLVRRETRGTQVKMGEMAALDHQDQRVIEGVLESQGLQAKLLVRGLEEEGKKVKRGSQGILERTA